MLDLADFELIVRELHIEPESLLLHRILRS